MYYFSAIKVEKVIKIDRKVPIPKTKGTGPSKYPFDKLEVEDSFFAPQATRFMIYGCLAHYNSKLKVPIKITTRTEKRGVRVWRIE